MTTRLLAPGLALALALLTSAPLAAQTQGRHQALDEVLDTYVRDGKVYYAALKASRASLRRYVAALDVPQATFDGWPAAERKAFLINAYNALVLDTVLDHYPIRGRSTDFPTESIRQIPGAFETRTHEVAGRTLTLDALEQWLLGDFNDARVLFALGRGGMGSGRLRSEAYVADRLDEQLDDATREFVTRQGHFRIEELTNTVEVTPLFSWRSAPMIAAWAEKADPVFAQRSPIERAILAVTMPHLFGSERAWLTETPFAMKFGRFDWRLNDLTGGRID